MLRTLGRKGDELNGGGGGHWGGEGKSKFRFATDNN